MKKNDFLKTIILKLKTNCPNWCKNVKQSRNVLEFTIEKDKKYFIISFDTPSHGKGLYHIQVNMYIYNMEITNIKKYFISKNRESVYFGNYNILPAGELERNYFFQVEDEEDDYKVDNILKNIMEYYYPIAYGMTADYNSILARVYDNNFLIGIRDRFTTLSIMAFSLNNEAWIYNTLIPIIKEKKLGENTNSIFYEYMNHSNAEDNILNPIRQLFLKR
ncbi:hypothetical protein [Listeria farberi]|uniref:Uncharacterized protein n=2 Tax=Listeria farberi TaxID=2713500 RepID=A0A7X1DDV3_9LIST|nr:hypothetical protein [Listeria farberi]MBC1374388.1 hypothetical protein [Listeria farberi]MBC1380960.1 hypothetical protein [Listeria farberi]MBC2267196.1 hypothetical protein [Listeria farberi]MBC2286656.1 hypothetical protein [Listeria farberi]